MMIEIDQRFPFSTKPNSSESPKNQMNALKNEAKTKRVSAPPGTFKAINNDKPANSP